MSVEESAKPEVEADVRVEAAEALLTEAPQQTVNFNPEDEIMITFGPGADPVKIDEKFIKYSSWWLKPNVMFQAWQSGATWLLSKAKANLEEKIDKNDLDLVEDIKVEEKNFSDSMYVLSEDEL